MVPMQKKSLEAVTSDSEENEEDSIMELSPDRASHSNKETAVFSVLGLQGEEKAGRGDANCRFHVYST
jgi:hypothetical protein